MAEQSNDASLAGTGAICLNHRHVVASAGWMAHALKKSGKVVTAASFIAAGMQVKYEEYDGFSPTRLRPFGTHR